MAVKRSLLRALLAEENRLRVEAENELSALRVYLTEGVLRENALANRVHLLEAKLREAGVQVP